MKVVVIGAVDSTKTLIEEMMNFNIEIAMIFSLDESISKDISGYYPLHEFAEIHGLPYKKYIKINDMENLEIIREIEPDYVFAVGFSQLVSKRLMDIPKYGVIGCHPAPLPKYRGRAVIVWQMLLGVQESKVTMFRIDEGIDSGDIIDQEPYLINEEDYAADVLKKADIALVRLYRRVLSMLVNGTCTFKRQDHSQATYCLKRVPEDGLIDWNVTGNEIIRLIRAVSRPYPGAYSYYDGKHKIIFWRAHLEKNEVYHGFPGQIAAIEADRLLIVLKDGLLAVEEYENLDNKKLFVGHRLGGLR